MSVPISQHRQVPHFEKKSDPLMKLPNSTEILPVYLQRRYLIQKQSSTVSAFMLWIACKHVQACGRLGQ